MPFYLNSFFLKSFKFLQYAYLLLCILRRYPEPGKNRILRPEQIEALKGEKNLENLTQYTIIQVMNAALPEPKVNGKVSLSERKLNKYFPSHMASREREKIILELLAKWKEEQEGYTDEA